MNGFGPLTKFIEDMVAQDGHMGVVNEDYYQTFLTLTQQQVEKLVIVIMLDQEKSVRRLAAGQADTHAVERVSKLVQNIVATISVGLARFDAFGCLGFVARIGSEPEPATDDALEQRYAEIAPIITNMVRRTLPWLLSRDISQGELPL